MVTIQHPAQNRIYPDETPIPDARAPLDTMPAGSFSSSNVHSALYDFGDRELVVRYKRDAADAVYRYVNVPAQIWSGLVEASSKGSYINRSVAYEYRYQKMGRDDIPDIREIDNPLARRFFDYP
jgi:hypothetical protein